MEFILNLGITVGKKQARIDKLLLVLLIALAGCGYSTKGYKYKEDKIRIKPVVNKIDISSENRKYSGYTAYPKLIEDRLTNKLVSEFNIQGGLNVVSKSEGALRLECQVVDYKRQTLRYTDSDDPQEQRLRLQVKMKLVDSEENVVQEKNIVGQTSFFLTGSNSKSEVAAQIELIDDTARRINEAVVETW
ncbi:MAG: LPS assembly lipoprotein LptE [Candidatus Omnitrophota bacterium]